MSNVYITYLITGFKNLTNNIIAKGNEKINLREGVKFKSPFEVVCRISSGVIYIYLFWIFGLYLILPSEGVEGVVISL